MDEMGIAEFVSRVDVGGQLSKYARELVRALNVKGVTVLLPSRARACLDSHRDRELLLLESAKFACNEGLPMSVVDVTRDGGFVSAHVEGGEIVRLSDRAASFDDTYACVGRVMEACRFYATAHGWHSPTTGLSVDIMDNPPHVNLLDRNRVIIHKAHLAGLSLDQVEKHVVAMLDLYL